jgi:hypothetical protein
MPLIGLSRSQTQTWSSTMSRQTRTSAKLMCPLDIPFDRIGAHGIGEIGIIAAGATISNAVFHASGRRAHELLITPTN